MLRYSVLLNCARYYSLFSIEIPAKINIATHKDSGVDACLSNGLCEPALVQL